jgi:hypothetical protein
VADLPDLGQFPHCDRSVLHAPSECEFCDRSPDWQALRVAWGIAFTGHAPERTSPHGPMQVPCPSDQRRETGQAHTWGGNRPTNVDVPQTETFASGVMYRVPQTITEEDADAIRARFLRTVGDPPMVMPHDTWQFAEPPLTFGQRLRRFFQRKAR